MRKHKDCIVTKEEPVVQTPLFPVRKFEVTERGLEELADELDNLSRTWSSEISKGVSDLVYATSLARLLTWKTEKARALAAKLRSDFGLTKKD